MCKCTITIRKPTILAWNLPGRTASTFLDYQIGEEVVLWGQSIYVGERDDLYRTEAPGTLPEKFYMAAINFWIVF